jgi:hypothetical protein
VRCTSADRTRPAASAWRLAATANVERLEQLDDPPSRLYTRSVDYGGFARLPGAGLETFTTEDEAAAALIAGEVHLSRPGTDPDLPRAGAPRYHRRGRPLPARSTFAVGKGDPDFWPSSTPDRGARSPFADGHQYWFRTLQWRD